MSWHTVPVKAVGAELLRVAVAALAAALVVAVDPRCGEALRAALKPFGLS